MSKQLILLQVKRKKWLSEVFLSMGIQPPKFTECSTSNVMNNACGLFSQQEIISSISAFWAYQVWFLSLPNSSGCCLNFCWRLSENSRGYHRFMIIFLSFSLKDKKKETFNFNFITLWKGKAWRMPQVN